MDQLVGGVVGVGPLAVRRSLGCGPAKGVVGVVVLGVDRDVVGGQVDQVQHVAGGVVLVRGARAVAHVLLHELPRRVVAVLHNQVVAAVVSFCKRPTAS